MSDDYYALLGVRPDVARSELRRAWRRLALQWHPDRAGENGAETFRKIQAAYSVLADPVSRAAYDRRRGLPPPIARGKTPAVRLNRVSGPIAGLLACGIARRAPNDVIELFLNRDEAATGGMVTISMRVAVRKGEVVSEELFSAWLAVPPGVVDGEILPPSALLPGMVNRVVFRVRLDT